MGCASAFHADKASSSLAARSNPPRSSSGPGCSPFKRDDIGSNPIRGSILHPSLRKGTPFSREGPGCGRGRTDPPLKRRSHDSARTFESCSRFQRSASAGKGFSLMDPDARIERPGQRSMPAWRTFRDAARAEHMAREGAAAATEIAAIAPQAPELQNNPLKIFGGAQTRSDQT
jgi:hypothetical protein